MASPRKAVLGKGLSALLPTYANAPTPDGDGAPADRRIDEEERLRLAGSVAELDIDTIRPNPYQPRTDFSDQALNELADSIRQLGIVQPLTVRSLGRGKYELIAGERRLRASKRAGLTRVPAYVREADSEGMIEMAIVENVQREDLNPIEVALGYQRLMEEVSLSQDQVAAKVGKSRPTVANALRLLKLPPRVQASLREGTISSGHARALVPMEDAQEMLALHREIVENGLSVRDVEQRVRQIRKAGMPPASAAPTPAKAPAADPLDERDRLEIERLRDMLRAAIGTQVSIRHKSADGSGTIEIEYYSADDLERVVERLAAE